MSEEMLDEDRAASRWIAMGVSHTHDKSLSFRGVKNKISADLVRRRVCLSDILQACPLLPFGSFPPFLKPGTASRMCELRGLNGPAADDIHLM
jgi:hypothetical protein